MEWEATESTALVYFTWPALSALVARAVAPSLKITFPLGVPPPGEVAPTVAVKITDWPKTVGLVEEVRVAVVSALLTTWLRAGELVLVVKLASPLYTAVSEW